jgi:hypothetical protein
MAFRFYHALNRTCAPSHYFSYLNYLPRFIMSIIMGSIFLRALAVAFHGRVIICTKGPPITDSYIHISTRTQIHLNIRKKTNYYQYKIGMRISAFTFLIYSWNIRYPRILRCYFTGTLCGALGIVKYHFFCILFGTPSSMPCKFLYSPLLSHICIYTR